jgi:hypothetical protein
MINQPTNKATSCCLFIIQRDATETFLPLQRFIGSWLWMSVLPTRMSVMIRFISSFCKSHYFANFLCVCVCVCVVLPFALVWLSSSVLRVIFVLLLILSHLWAVFYFCFAATFIVYWNWNIVFRVVFWVILPCKMIVDRRFRGAYCLHHTRCRENFKSHMEHSPLAILPSEFCHGSKAPPIRFNGVVLSGRILYLYQALPAYWQQRRYKV